MIRFVSSVVALVVVMAACSQTPAAERAAPGAGSASLPPLVDSSMPTSPAPAVGAGVPGRACRGSGPSCATA